VPRKPKPEKNVTLHSRARRTPRQMKLIADAVLRCLAEVGPMGARRLAETIPSHIHAAACSPRTAHLAPSGETKLVSLDRLHAVGREIPVGSEDSMIDALDLYRHVRNGGDVDSWGFERGRASVPDLEPDPRAMLHVFRFLEQRALIECVGRCRGATWRLSWFVSTRVAVLGVEHGLFTYAPMQPDLLV
jgi:hypothetical protein